MSTPLELRNESDKSLKKNEFHISNRTFERKDARQYFHCLLSSYRWDEAIEQMMLDNKDPPLAAIRDEETGDLPLHMSLKRSAPEYFILEVIDYHSKAVHQSGLNDKSLPLHLAVVYNATPRVVLTLLRKFPEALDMRDSDGDTPRACVRKNTDDVVKDVITKPVYYWTKLFKEVSKNDPEAINTRKKEKEITLIQKQVRAAEERLEKAKTSEDEMFDQLNDLEHRIEMLEIKAFKSKRRGSLKTRIQELSEKLTMIDAYIENKEPPHDSNGNS